MVCEYKNCNQEVWEESKDNYCILHDKDSEKPQKLFDKKFIEVLKKLLLEDRLILYGYIFPEKCCNFQYYLRESLSEEIKIADFYKGITFVKCEFYDKAYFHEISFLYFKCIETTFHHRVDFSNCTFSLKSEFKDVKFLGEIDKDDNQGDLGIYLNDFVSFRRTNFKKLIKFKDVDFKVPLILDDSEFDSIECNNVEFKNPEDGEKLYRKASSIWINKNDRDKADHHFKLMMQMKRRQKNRVIQIMECIFVDSTIGYGTQ